ncbi:hypothetical protein DENIS_4149 [Desulfonema ishimotonii]|uniref:Uncharacterized protein n=1 Tax=Desulfonema ishimotonii TaxID=45657 RepID=A0A401G1S6_9BACT|nr:YjbH domain-containing protein [Desulfonema ishimotonii]GBC63156.1 hypothetical protein DENIS_4149 [Desulfonema ishimotonii]
MSTVEAMQFEAIYNPIGYYVGAAYRFTDWFELGAYYSEYYEDEDE